MCKVFPQISAGNQEDEQSRVIFFACYIYMHVQIAFTLQDCVRGWALRLIRTPEAVTEII